MEFTELIQYILYVVLTAILPVAAKYTVNLIQARIRESSFIEEAAKTEARSILIKDALSDVMDAVLYVNQTFVDTLKTKGEFTESAWKEAKQKAYNAALLTVSEESKKAVAAVYGSFDNWLQLKIEASVKAAKTSKDVIL